MFIPVDSNNDYADHTESPNLPVQFIPTNAAESVIMTTLQPGAYTAIVRVVNQSVCIGIVEVFEVDGEVRDRSREGHLYEFCGAKMVHVCAPNPTYWH